MQPSAKTPKAMVLIVREFIGEVLAGTKRTHVSPVPGPWYSMLAGDSLNEEGGESIPLGIIGCAVSGRHKEGIRKQ
jgi:hypothetical protein